MTTFTNILNNSLKNKAISAWQITNEQINSHEIYLVGSTIESIRESSVTTDKVHIFMNHDDPKQMGETHFQTDGEQADPEKKIQNAIERASNVRNPRYDLARPEQAKEINIEQNLMQDLRVSETPEATLNEIYEVVQGLSAKDLNQCKLSYLEVFLENRTKTLTNSHGLQLKQQATSVTYDMAILSPDNQYESQIFITRNYLKDLPIDTIIHEETKNLMNLYNAIIPPTGKFPVVLADEALDHIFDYYKYHLSAPALYQKTNKFKKGDSIYEGACSGDPLTLSANPRIAGCSLSIPFDEYGFPTKKITLVDRGIVNNISIDGKHAALLKMPMTSIHTNTSVETGDNEYSSFLENGVFELLRFSTFTPDPISGSFSGEIRLGYWYKNGKKIPIKGGSVSGDIDSAFKNCYFSSEKVKRKQTHGPKGIFFTELTIAGTEN